jgi:predicted aldo/keto reductase-like oxidoreductase
MDGKKHKLSEYIGKGNYTVLHFWSTEGWASRATMSTYMKIVQNYDDSKVRVVGFSLCYSKDDCKRYVENRKMNWTQLYADKHFHNEATKAYGVIAHPESIIFGPDGMIVAEGLQGKALENKVKELVGEMDRKE